MVPDGQAQHVESAVAPTAAEYVPAPQSVQTPGPTSALYFPATHAVHGRTPLLEDAPAGHGSLHWGVISEIFVS